MPHPAQGDVASLLSIDVLQLAFVDFFNKFKTFVAAKRSNKIVDAATPRGAGVGREVWKVRVDGGDHRRPGDAGERVLAIQGEPDGVR